MSIQIISDFNPTQTMYAIGDDKHVECMIDGRFNDNFQALSTMIANFVSTSAETCMKDMSEEKYDKLKSRYEGKDLTRKDIGIILVWTKLQDEVNKELVKMKMKEHLDIPDVIKNMLPKQMVDQIVSQALDHMLEQEGDSEDE